jgi:hypothetical protein
LYSWPAHANATIAKIMANGFDGISYADSEERIQIVEIDLKMLRDIFICSCVTTGSIKGEVSHFKATQTRQRPVIEWMEILLVEYLSHDLCKENGQQ